MSIIYSWSVALRLLNACSNDRGSGSLTRGNNAVMLNMIATTADLRDDDSLKSWVYRIATNEALRHLRKNSLESYPIDDAPAGLLELRADEYTDYSDLEAVKLQKAINSLPEKQRVAFNLRYYDELSYEEIAEITGSTPASAKVSYHIAKNRVINFMNNHD